VSPGWAHPKGDPPDAPPPRRIDWVTMSLCSQESLAMQGLQSLANESMYDVVYSDLVQLAMFMVQPIYTL
jgi:hypothetical protein